MAKAQFTGKYKGNKYIIDVQVSLYIWEDEQMFYVYAPALDITGYDTTEEGAKKSFANILSSTLEYMHNKDTLFDELERLGWTVNRKKKRVSAPSLDEIIEDNEEMKELLTTKGLKKEQTAVEFAL